MKNQRKTLLKFEKKNYNYVFLLYLQKKDNAREQNKTKKKLVKKIKLKKGQLNKNIFNINHFSCLIPNLHS